MKAGTFLRAAAAAATLISAGCSASATKNEYVLAFGSCQYEWATEELHDAWSVVSSTIDADAMVWMGDTVYLDTKRQGGLAFRRVDSLRDARASFETVRAHVPALQEFLRGGSSGPRELYAMWDDHDCGKDECDRSYPYIERMRNFFLDSVAEPMYSQRRTRANRGIYFDELIELAPLRNVHLIMLDLRTFRDAKWHGDMLGEEQWRWLEETLAEKRSKRRDNSMTWTLLVSSVTVLPTDVSLNIESWDKFPSERHRLLSLARRYTHGGPSTNSFLILSGDVHQSGIFLHTCVSRSPASASPWGFAAARGERGAERDPELEGFPFWEATSSGMTHSVCNESKGEASAANSSFAVGQTVRRTVGALRFDPYGDANFGVVIEVWPVPAEATPLFSARLTHENASRMDGRMWDLHRDKHCPAERDAFGSPANHMGSMYAYSIGGSFVFLCVLTLIASALSWCCVASASSPEAPAAAKLLKSGRPKRIL